MHDDDILDNALKPDNNKSEKDLDVLKELFKLKEIETKSDLSVHQIILLNQKRMIAKLLDWDSLDMALQDFMFLLVSKDRKGRSEFVDGFKSERETSIAKSGGGFMSSIKNGLMGK